MGDDTAPNVGDSKQPDLLIDVRVAGSDDVQQLSIVGLEAWEADYADALGEAVMEALPRLDASIAQLVSLWAPRTPVDAKDRLTLTVEEAGELLGISRALAYEAVRRGEIPSLRIGNRIVVPKAALMKMLDVSPRIDTPNE